MVMPRETRFSAAGLAIETEIDPGPTLVRQPEGMGSTSPQPADSKASNKGEPQRFPLWQSAPLVVTLFGFWVLLSGKLDAFHLGAGALCSVAIGWYSARLFRLPPAIGRDGQHPLLSVPVLSFLLFVPWLAREIVVASLQVVRVVYSPNPQLRPRLFWTPCRLPHNIARLTFANSITLTPGTVTIDVDGDRFLVHALTESSASDLESEASSMKLRIHQIYPTETRT